MLWVSSIPGVHGDYNFSYVAAATALNLNGVQWQGQARSPGGQQRPPSCKLPYALLGFHRVATALGSDSLNTGEQLEAAPHSIPAHHSSQPVWPSSEDKLGAQLYRAAAKVTRAVVIKERAGHIGKGKGHGADPELIGPVKVVLIHEER